MAALRCLALDRLGKRDQARQASIELGAKFAGDARGRAWGGVTEALIAHDEPNYAAAMKAIRQMPGEGVNVYLKNIFAECYLQTGDTQSAFERWQQVVELAPAWAAPRTRVAQLALATGQY